MDHDIVIIISIITVARRLSTVSYVTLLHSSLMILGKGILELLIVAQFNQIIRQVVAKVECILWYALVDRGHIGQE